jgi:hypothetical protein
LNTAQLNCQKESRFEKTTRQLMATHFRFHDCTGQFNINQQLTNQSPQSKTTIIQSSTPSPATSSSHSSTQSQTQLPPQSPLQSSTQSSSTADDNSQKQDDSSLVSNASRFCSKCHKPQAVGHSKICVPIKCDGRCEWQRCPVKKEQHVQLKESMRVKSNKPSITLHNVANKRVAVEEFKQVYISQIADELKLLEQEYQAKEQSASKISSSVLQASPVKRLREDEDSEDSSAKKARTELDESLVTLDGELDDDNIPEIIQNLSFSGLCVTGNQDVMKKLQEIQDDADVKYNVLLKRVTRIELYFKAFLDTFTKKKGASAFTATVNTDQ